jgi:hypothetical protein
MFKYLKKNEAAFKKTILKDGEGSKEVQITFDEDFLKI